MAKSRQILIEDLDTILHYIKLTEAQANDKIENNVYYRMYGTEDQFNHRIEIKRKALAFWRRKFNRVLSELKY